MVREFEVKRRVDRAIRSIHDPRLFKSLMAELSLEADSTVDGAPLIVLAAAFNNQAAMAALADAGANVDAYAGLESVFAGMAAIHLVPAGSVPLIAKHANDIDLEVRAGRAQGNTALTLALANSDLSKARELLRFGASDGRRMVGFRRGYMGSPYGTSEAWCVEGGLTAAERFRQLALEPYLLREGHRGHRRSDVGAHGAEDTEPSEDRPRCRN